MWVRATLILVVFLVTSILDKYGSSASSRKSYQVSFPNSSDTDGIFPYIRVVDAIPVPLTQFTLCYWARPVLYETETIFSYAVPGYEGGDNEIWAGINPKYGVFFTHRTEYYDVIALMPITLHQWMHVCLNWSSIDGNVNIYVNGRITKSASGIGKGKPVAANGMLILGQDQDGLEGGFQATQAWKGDVTELHMWDNHLKVQDIYLLSVCEIEPDGNVLSWNDVKMKMYGGIELGPVNLTCASNK